MIERWIAKRYIDVFLDSSMQPFVADCVVAPSDESSKTDVTRNENTFTPFRVLTKSLRACGPFQVTALDLFSEVFGNLLARELSINTPRPGLVQLDDLFVQAVRMADQPADVRPGIGAGSEFVSPLAPISVSERLLAEDIPDAIRIFAFDLLVNNRDRYVGNPNCARHQGRLLAFDFNQAFGFLRRGEDDSPPWAVGDQRIGARHILHAQLSRWTKELDFGPFVTDIGRLTEGRMYELASGLPVEWQGWADPVIAHITAIQNNAKRFEVELWRSVI